MKYVRSNTNNKLSVIVAKGLLTLLVLISFNNIIIITSSKTQSTGDQSLKLDLLQHSQSISPSRFLFSSILIPQHRSTSYQAPQKISKHNTQALVVFGLKYYILHFPAIPSFRTCQCPLWLQYYAPQNIKQLPTFFCTYSKQC